MIGTGTDGAHTESADAVGSTYGEELAVRRRLGIAVAIDDATEGTHSQQTARRERNLPRVLHRRLDELGKGHTQEESEDGCLGLPTQE